VLNNTHLEPMKHTEDGWVPDLDKDPAVFDDDDLEVRRLGA